MWTDLFINAICDGNDLYDELYSETAHVYLDVDDVVQSVGTEFLVQSTSPIVGFTNSIDFVDLITHISNFQQPSYGVIIGSSVTGQLEFLFKPLAFVPL